MDNELPTSANVPSHGLESLCIRHFEDGLPLHEQGLSGAAFRGNCRTHERFPMLIAGPRFAPMMFKEPGVGLQVAGELYGIDDRALLRLDRIESVGVPGNWRVPIEVEPLEGGPSTMAQVYMKSRRLADPIHSGYLACYNDRRFVLPDGHRQVVR
ncbi:gamma-glutamylcyclotransferase [Mesorhizobium sp. WSM4935]|uniref:gamma-glutamylcyclotransferase family protein n=1 Tax=Mesorhizobium sp. WSM4935 TaxID=3038547 RepID=UPI00241501C2|nr:gamma-glutamylcyclotransferase family protein [Mesorhizobium sp. WSM4935]MDG4876144.1 gamma-glutamylcyclotransferase [Mesorhizobium sp. WSM4935]